MVKPSVLLAALLFLAFGGCGDDGYGDGDTGGTGGGEARIVVTSPAEGEVIARAFATATAGAPERGDFSKEVEFTVGEAQDGVVEAFEQNAASPGEGSQRQLFKVEVPVKLEP